MPSSTGVCKGTLEVVVVFERIKHAISSHFLVCAAPFRTSRPRFPKTCFPKFHISQALLSLAHYFHVALWRDRDGGAQVRVVKAWLAL